MIDQVARAVRRTGSPARALRRLEWPAIALAIAPLVLFAYRALRDGFYPVFDDALIALRIHDVFSTHPPTVGAGTSYGLIAVEANANHPGPLPFFLLAPGYALSGFRSFGLVLSLTVYHAAFVVLTARLARRVGGPGLLVAAMAGILLLERSLGGDAFISPWNPHLALLPFLAFLFAAWATLRERSSCSLPWVALTGSVAVQAQVGFAPSVVVIGLTLVSAVAHRALTNGFAGQRRPVLVAAAVGLVAWSLPLVQQLTSADGNLGRLLSWFVDGSDRGDPIGLRRGVEHVVHVIGRVPPPIADFSAAGDSHLVRRPSAVLVLVSAVVVVLLVVVIARHRRGPTARVGAVGAVVALAALLTSVVTASRVTGGAADQTYQFLYLWVIAAFTLVLLGWALGRALAARARRPTDRARQVVNAVALVVLIVLAVSASRETGAFTEDYQRARFRPIIDRTVAALAAGESPYLVSCVGGSRLSLCGALLLALETNDIRVIADPDSTALYGPDSRWRFADGGERLPSVVVGAGRWLAPPTPDARLLAARATSGLRFRDLPPGRLTSPDEEAAFEAATAALTEANLTIDDDDLGPLRAKRGEEIAIEVGDGWFRGRTVEEWQDLIDTEPGRFVRSGGLAVLDAAGVLAGHAGLAEAAASLAGHPDRDAVWLLPPRPAPGPRS